MVLIFTHIVSFHVSFMKRTLKLLLQYFPETPRAISLGIEILFKLGSQIKIPWEFRGNFVGSQTVSSGQLPPLLPGQSPPKGNHPPRQFNPPDNSHLGLLYCLQIITPQQLLPRAMKITNYNCLMAIFCFFSMAQLYNFCDDNKNNNDNSNKTWSLKLLSVIEL